MKINIRVRVNDLVGPNHLLSEACGWVSDPRLISYAHEANIFSGIYEVTPRRNTGGFRPILRARESSPSAVVECQLIFPESVRNGEGSHYHISYRDYILARGGHALLFVKVPLSPEEQVISRIELREVLPKKVTTDPWAIGKLRFKYSPQFVEIGVSDDEQSLVKKL
jgi:hypothetical protein